jgi:hypothetical protein
MGMFNKSHEPSSTGVFHTNLPWFRQILPVQGNGKKGVQIEEARQHRWTQVKEDRHKDWTNTGMIPSEIKKVENYEDFLRSTTSSSNTWVDGNVIYFITST